MKKHFFSSLLSFALLGFVAQPVFANNDNTAKISAVKKMYSFYNVENEYQIPKQFFTESLRDVMRRQDRYDAIYSIGEMSECTESGVFDIYFSDYHNPKQVINSGTYTVLSNGNVKVSLKEKTSYGVSQDTRIFKLKKEHNSWKIDDMLYDDGSSFKRSADLCLRQFGY